MENEEKKGGIVMSDNNNINSKDFLIGSLIGGLVGASVALLLAPKSGKELREDINDQATVVKERTNQLTATAKEKGTELAGAAKEKGDYFSKTISEQSSEIINKVKSLKNNNEDVFATYDDIDNETEENLSPKQENAEEVAEQPGIRV
jgi:gas vesicle protein